MTATRRRGDRSRRTRDRGVKVIHKLERRIPYYEATFGDSMSWEQWHEEGELDARQRANANWKARLANHESPPLPAGVDEALTEFVDRKKASVEDAWY